MNSTQKWLEIKDESIILRDVNNGLVAETINLTDEDGDSRTWQRVFYGLAFLPATKNMPDE